MRGWWLGAVASLACSSPDYPGAPERVRPECGTGDRSLGAFCCSADECDSAICRDAVCTAQCEFNTDCGPCDSGGCPTFCMVQGEDDGFCYRDCEVRAEACEGDTECRLISEMPDVDSGNNTNHENLALQRLGCFRLPEEG